MAKDRVNTTAANARWRLTEPGLRVLLLVTAMGCAGVALAVPRPVAPTEMPPLDLDRAAIGRVLAHERAEAKKAPDDGPGARLREVYYAEGISESGTGETRGESARRSAKVGRALLAVQKEPNADAILGALRAQAAEGMEPALEGRSSPHLRRELLGGFPKMLERYHLVENGRRAAPDFVVRVLFEARWNGAVRLPLTHGFAPVQLEAYWGWLAFHGEGVDVRQRLRALDAYAKAGGRHVDEARGVLSYEGGDFVTAARSFRAAYARSGNLRLRNQALAATVAGSSGG